MKEDFLRQYLNKLTLPTASESSRSRARHRALIAFEQRNSHAPESGENKAFVWNWRYVVVFIGLAWLMPFLLFRPQAATENLANDRQILGQMEKLFPDQVDSVVEQNGKVDLSVAQFPVVGSDQPVVVTFERGHDRIRVLSFSGHHVCLMLGKRMSCFEILATPNGGVILEGEGRAWMASEHPIVSGYSLRGEALKATL